MKDNKMQYISQEILCDQVKEFVQQQVNILVRIGVRDQSQYYAYDVDNSAKINLIAQSQTLQAALQQSQSHKCFMIKGIVQNDGSSIILTELIPFKLQESKNVSEDWNCIRQQVLMLQKYQKVYSGEVWNNFDLKNQYEEQEERAGVNFEEYEENISYY